MHPGLASGAAFSLNASHIHDLIGNGGELLQYSHNLQ